MTFNLENISMNYSPVRDEGVLFKNIKIDFPTSSIVTLVGPNGSGKSSLLKIMAGLIKPLTGNIVINGKNILDYSYKERADLIAYLPQTTPLYYNLTVKELVQLGRRRKILSFDSDFRISDELVMYSLERVNMQLFANRKIFSLSGGELQRVLIARVLMGNAQIVLLDEITTSLDIEHVLQIMDIIKELATNGKLVIFSMHDFHFASEYSEFTLLLGYHNENRYFYDRSSQVMIPSILEKTFNVKIELTKESYRFRRHN